MEIKKRYITPSLIRETIEDTILLSTSPNLKFNDGSVEVDPEEIPDSDDVEPD